MASHDVPIGATQVSLAALNERSREIFRHIVESYLTTGEPVGSRNLSRMLPITLSPASVRNVMSDLEQLGLIFAPHTSAGRLPTELGLRFFVDALMQIGDLTESDRRSIEAQVAGTGSGKSLETVLDRSLADFVGPDPFGRRGADRANQCAAQTYRIRAAGAGTRARRAGGGRRPGRKPRAQCAGRRADLGAGRGGKFSQRPHPRQDAGRIAHRNRSRASGGRRPSSINSRRRSSRPALRAGRAAKTTTAS